MTTTRDRTHDAARLPATAARAAAMSATLLLAAAGIVLPAAARPKLRHHATEHRRRLVLSVLQRGAQCADRGGIADLAEGLCDAGAHEREPRVRDAGHPRVGDERDVAPTSQRRHDLPRPLGLVAREEGAHRDLDADVREEPTGAPSVLARDEVHLGEHGAGALGQVREVPDRGTDDVEGSAHGQMFARG